MQTTNELHQNLIAIDPGNIESAVVVWNGEKIQFAKKMFNEPLRTWLKEQLTTFPGITVHCEMIASYGMPVGVEVFETCLMIGSIQQITFDNGGMFRKVFRKDVKMHLCNSMRAKDSNIRQSLIDRFGAPGTKKNQGLTYGLSGDLWAAFAVAVTAFDTYPFTTPIQITGQ
jgi:hypothetical protein